MIGKLHAFEAAAECLDLTTVEDQVHELGYDHVHEVSGKALAATVDCRWTHHLREHGVLETYREHLRGREPAPFPLDDRFYCDQYIGDHAVEWLKGYDSEQPFFLWASFCSPHPPFDAPTLWLERTPETGNVKRRHYAAMIELVDHQVGRLLDVLDERGLAERTLVIFVSDHGEMLGDLGLGGKCWPYDPSIRVPLLMRYPGIVPAGRASDAMVELLDITATCVALGAGNDEVRASLPCSPGLSLVKHWAEPDCPMRDTVYSEDGGQFIPLTKRYAIDGGSTSFSLASNRKCCSIWRTTRTSNTTSRTSPPRLRSRTSSRRRCLPA